MSFLNPWGLLSLLSIPVLVILYILKQQHSEHIVPSTYLWRKTEIFMQAATPWQKLRKNLLFFLQLLMLLFLSFAISRPVLMSEKASEDLVVVIDTSASMRAEDASPSRFKFATNEIDKLINGLVPGQKMSIIEAGYEVNLLITKSSNKQLLKNTIQKLSCGYGDANIDGAISLAEGIVKESNSSKIILYSDKQYSNSGGISVVNVAKTRNNVSISQVSSAYVNNSYTVMSTVVSYGNAKNITLELYIDDKLSDARTIQCEKDKPVHTYWQNISSNAGYVKVKIEGKDDLEDDNEAFAVLSKNDKQKILLVSDESFFYEKVLNAVGNYDIYKTTKDKAETQKGFDLYIYDNYVPVNIQKDGNVWFINPDKDFLGIKLGEQIKGTKLTIAETITGRALSSYISADNIYLARFREAVKHDNWEISMKCGEIPAILTYSTGNSQRHIALMFNLSESNLPLLKEFPVLIQNMLTYTLPSVIDGDGRYTSGEQVLIRALPNATKVKVKDPLRNDTLVSPPFPPDTYMAHVPGLYLITQDIRKSDSENVKNEGYFTVMIPQDESSLPTQGHSLELGKSKNIKVKGAFELWPYLLLVVIIAAIFEWWVYYRGNQL